MERRDCSPPPATWARFTGWGLPARAALRNRRFSMRAAWRSGASFAGRVRTGRARSRCGRARATASGPTLPGATGRAVERRGRRADHQPERALSAICRQTLGHRRCDREHQRGLSAAEQSAGRSFDYGSYHRDRRCRIWATRRNHRKQRPPLPTALPSPIRATPRPTSSTGTPDADSFPRGAAAVGDLLAGRRSRWRQARLRTRFPRRRRARVEAS